MSPDSSAKPPSVPPLPDTVESPAPTAAPIFVAAGIAMLLGGVITSLAFCVAGAVLAVGGMAAWIVTLTGPARHVRQPLAPPDRRPRPIVPVEVGVEKLRPGKAGYRLTLPEKYHPYSAGAKGGALGGVAMALTAIAYGVFSGHGPWYPINLLAGMVLWSYGALPTAELQQFRFDGLVAATVTHAVASVGVGLIYGVLLPTLPGRPIVSGGLVAPLLWTGAIYAFMGVLNPPLHEVVVHRSVLPWFVASQFVYGLVVGMVVIRSEQVYAEPIGAGPSGADSQQHRRSRGRKR
jgi:hypothetical protein